jgi:hypothetical protein
MAEQEEQGEPTTVSIIDYSMQNKPTKVADTFNQIMSAKVVDSLATKKQEISAAMFADKIEPEVETTEEQ